jgi:hypothetical protein
MKLLELLFVVGYYVAPFFFCLKCCSNWFFWGVDYAFCFLAHYWDNAWRLESSKHYYGYGNLSLIFSPFRHICGLSWVGQATAVSLGGSSWLTLQNKP